MTNYWRHRVDRDIESLAGKQVAGQTSYGLESWVYDLLQDVVHDAVLGHVWLLLRIYPAKRIYLLRGTQETHQ